MTAPFGSPNRLARGAPVVLLLAMFSMGGGSAAGPLPQLLAQLAGIGLLVSALSGLAWRPMARADVPAALLAGGLILLLGAQLVPLPGSVWPRIPGRSLYLAGDMLMFGEARSRPLSLDPDETLAGLVLLAPAFAVWLHTRRDPAFAERFAVAYLAFLAASLALALAQLAAGPGSLRLYPTTHDDLPTGFFANRNHQSIAMVCGIPLAAALHRGRRALDGLLVSRLSVTVITVGCVVGALLTGSRTGAALLLPSIAASLFIALGGRKAPGGLNAHSIVGARVGLIASAVLLLLVVLGLAASMIRPGGALGLVFSRSFIADDARYAYWPVVNSMIRDSLPWGIGFGSFRYAFEVASTPAVLRPLYINHAHNDWLEFLLEGGLPGLALACGFVVWLIVRWRQALRMPDRVPLATAAGVVIALLLAHSTFDYPLRTITLAACFAFCAGLLSPSPPDAQRQQERPRSWRGRIALGVLALVLAGTALNGAIRQAAARSGQTQLAVLLPAPGARLLAARALQMATSGAPFGSVADVASRAAAISPLTEPAFTASGLASPDPEQASALLDHALRLSRRDPVLLLAQWRRARTTGQPVTAFAMVDAMYRLQAATPAIGRDVGHDLANPAFLAEATRALSSGVGWRGRFLADMASSSGNRPALLRLVEGVQRSPSPLDRSELAGAIGELSFGTVPDPLVAFKLWQQLRPTADSLDWQLPQSAQPPLPFDWSLSDNARIARSGNALRLEFDGQAGSAPLAMVKQPLAAGGYRVAISASRPGAALAISCGAVRLRLLDGDRFDWPNACPAADLAIYAAGDDGWIGAVRLVPQG